MKTQKAPPMLVYRLGGKTEYLGYMPLEEAQALYGAHNAEITTNTNGRKTISVYVPTALNN